MKTRMKRVVNIAVPILIALGLVILFYFLLDGKQIDVLNPSGEVALAQRNLLLFTITLSAVVVLPVFAMLIYFSVTYRAGNKKANYMPEWGENKILESLWWGIPIIIIGVLGVLTYQTSHSLDPRKALSGGEPLEVQVVAMRWKWLFIYPEQQVASLNYIAIPVGKPVRFTMTADAPMSAFWIPALGSQIYAMNGMQSTLNLKATSVGEYTGYTTNINGEGYAKMKFTAKSMKQADFTKWVQKSTQSTELMNMNQYKLLSEPKSVTEERTYKLANTKLFDLITEQFGHGSHGAKAS